MATLCEVPDFVGLIRTATVDPVMRALAAGMYAKVMTQEHPLAADHGSHHPRASDVGRCSLELCADIHGLLDLPRTDDNQLLLDSGTIYGVWLACLLKAASYRNAFAVHLEYNALYRGSSGHIDALIEHFGETRMFEPVEFKSTPSSGEIKSPAERKINQCMQAAQYGLDPTIESERFTIVTYGYNVGNNKVGIPHAKLVQHTFLTADWKPLVDAEIDRLEILAKSDKEAVIQNASTLADATQTFYCVSCRYSNCERNQNPLRFAL